MLWLKLQKVLPVILNLICGPVASSITQPDTSTCSNQVRLLHPFWVLLLICCSEITTAKPLFLHTVWASQQSLFFWPLLGSLAHLYCKVNCSTLSSAKTHCASPQINRTLMRHGTKFSKLTSQVGLYFQRSVIYWPSRISPESSGLHQSPLESTGLYNF